VLRKGKDYVMERTLKIAIIISISCYLYADPPGYYSVGPMNCDYTDIQSAINNVPSETYFHIEVYADTYEITSPIDFLGKSIRVFSRDGASSTIIERTNSGCVVKFATGETGSAELIGFTITGGTGKTVSSQEKGGGIYIENSGPQIEDCIITGNSADLGAGIYADSPASTFLVDNCVIKDNDNTGTRAREIYLEDGAGLITGCTIGPDAFPGGEDPNSLGGIYLDNMYSWFTLEESTIHYNNGSGVELRNGSNVDITDCTINYNKTSEHGGGINCYGSSPTIEDCNIKENEADKRVVPAGYDGGGIYCYNASPTIENCIIYKNKTGSSSSGNGGGIYCQYQSSPTITKCVITDNENPEGWGGGIYCEDESNPTITNCIIAGNSAGENYGEGGGLCCVDESCPEIFNCTITKNLGTTEEIYWVNDDTDALITIKNCIVWNDNSNDPYYFNGNGGDPDIDYTDINDEESNFPSGRNNIDVDPEFVDPSNGDYHLKEDSPCIDEGTDTGAPSNDLDGRSRPCDTTDMGAYEFCETTDFYRGDANEDGSVNVSDVTTITGYLSGSWGLNCLDSADVNDDGIISTSDTSYLLNYIYSQGPTPKPPFSSCDTDPTGDALTCGSFDQEACP
jgi:hypothetical protein